MQGIHTAMQIPPTSTAGMHEVPCGARARIDLSHHHSLFCHYLLKKRENQGQIDSIKKLLSVLAWSQGKLIPLQWMYILTLQVYIAEEFVKGHDRKTYKKPETHSAMPTDFLCQGRQPW